MRFYVSGDILALSLWFGVGLSAEYPAQTERSEDWNTVRRLKDGTRVLVTTRQGRGIDGRLNTVREDALQMVVRWGRKQTLLRDDVREVRLGHRLSVGQHAGPGLLLGGVTGFLVGSAAACDPNVCGGREDSRSLAARFTGSLWGASVALWSEKRCMPGPGG
jgi:hypothetical protein